MFGLFKYSSDKYAIKPPDSPRKSRTKTVEVRPDNPNLSVDKITGRYVLYNHVDGQKREHEWNYQVTKKEDYGQRSRTLTQIDMELIEAWNSAKGKRYRLDVKKASRIKVLWAAGYTYKEIEQEIKEKGYSERTVADYGGLFTTALSLQEGPGV